MEKTVSETLSQAFRRVEDAPTLGLIGDTPLLRIKLFEKEFPNVEVYAKAKWFNPGGSVKDRPPFIWYAMASKEKSSSRA